MNVNATLDALVLLIKAEKAVELDDNLAAAKILSSAIYSLNTGLRAYLTRGEGKD